MLLVEANVYKQYTIRNPLLDLEEKQDVYTIALGITMGTTEFDNINKLTEEQAKDVVNLFKTL